MFSASVLPTADFIIIHFADLTGNDAQLKPEQQASINKCTKQEYNRVLDRTEIPWFSNVANLSTIVGYDLSNQSPDAFATEANVRFKDMVILKKRDKAAFTATNAVDAMRSVLRYGLDKIQCLDEIIRLEHYVLQDASVWLVEIDYEEELVNPPVTQTSISPFMMPLRMSDTMCEFLGMPKDSQLSRTDITRKLAEYINTHNLKNPDNKRAIIPDDKLRALLNAKPTDEITYLNLQRYISPHVNKAN